MGEAGGGIIGIALIFFLIYWAIKIGLIILVVLLGGIVLAIIPALISWVFYKTFQAFINNEFEQTRAIIFPCLTVLTGVSVASLKLGFISPFVIFGLVGGGIPLVVLLIYPPINRRRLIKKYQEGEKHLIAP